MTFILSFWDYLGSSSWPGAACVAKAGLQPAVLASTCWVFRLKTCITHSTADEHLIMNYSYCQCVYMLCVCGHWAKDMMFMFVSTNLCGAGFLHQPLCGLCGFQVQPLSSGLYGKHFDLLSHDACPSDECLCTILLHILDNFHFHPHFLSVFAGGQRQKGLWLYKAAS